MAQRLWLILLLLLQTLFAPVSLGAEARRAGCEGPACQPAAACALADGCCCEAAPVPDLPEPEPLPATGLERIQPVILAPSIATTPTRAPDGLVAFRARAQITIEPEMSLRRLARLCVWRT